MRPRSAEVLSPVESLPYYRTLPYCAPAQEKGVSGRVSGRDGKGEKTGWRPHLVDLSTLGIASPASEEPGAAPASRPMGAAGLVMCRGRDRRTGIDEELTRAFQECINCTD